MDTVKVALDSTEISLDSTQTVLDSASAALDTRFPAMVVARVFPLKFPGEPQSMRFDFL